MPLRIRFWYFVHDRAERLWHWVYRAKIQPWHAAQTIVRTAAGLSPAYTDAVHPAIIPPTGSKHG